MKNFLLALALFSSLSSCTTYQYLQLSSSTVKQDESRQFVIENDTVMLRYNFNGYNGPIKLSVHNKTNKPLYVDWKKSAVIIQGKAFSYYSPNQQLNGSSSSTQLNWGNGIRTESGTIHAEILAQEGVDFIPPRSIKERNSFQLLGGYLGSFAEDSMKKQYPGGDKTQPRLKTIDFLEENSPLRFRSYLSFYTEEPERRQFSLEHDFYVSRIHKGPFAPYSITVFTDRPDISYTSTLSGFGKGAGFVAGVGILAAIGTAAANNDR